MEDVLQVKSTGQHDSLEFNDAVVHMPQILLLQPHVFLDGIDSRRKEDKNYKNKYNLLMLQSRLIDYVMP